MLLLPFLLPSAGAETQTGTYVGVNPRSSTAPNCAIAPPGVGPGLGGACFAVPSGAERFQVSIQDDVLGPGFGALNLCIDEPSVRRCQVFPICGGILEGDVRAGTTSAWVVVYGATSAMTFCGSAALGWAPTHGTITLDLAAAAP